MRPTIHPQVHAMRDHPAHNVPLLGASWAARLSQVLLIRHQKHVVINISVILRQTFERNGDAAGKRCWPILSAGRQPLPKGQTRKGTLLSEDSISNSDFQNVQKKHHSWQHRHHQPFSQELLTKYIWSWARHMAVGMRVTVIGFYK